MRRLDLACFLLAACVQVAWSMTMDGPLDWDPAYYEDVARSIVEVGKAESAVAWHASMAVHPPPYVADTHWMPLPSRILVPGRWVWPEGGAALTGALLAAGWAPLAARLARGLGASPGIGLIAALMAGFGGGYARMAASTDSIGLYGCVGGALGLAALELRWGLAALLAAAAALTRGDGFLLGLCAGLAIGGRQGVVVGLSGLAAMGAWNLRNLLLDPEVFRAGRAAALGALSMGQFLEGHSDWSVLDRVGVVVRELGQGMITAGVAALFLLPVPFMVGLRGMRQPGRRLSLFLLAYGALMPIVTLSLSPAIASSGTLYRSGAALFPGCLAISAVGVGRVVAWLYQHRGLHPAFLFGIWCLAWMTGSVGAGLANKAARPKAPVDCTPLKDVALDEVVLSGRPLLVRAHCGHAGVYLGPDVSADLVAARALRTGSRVALLPEREMEPGLPVAADVARLLPGWKEVRPGLYRAP
jgi:hypothetical protein